MFVILLAALTFLRAEQQDIRGGNITLYYDEDVNFDPWIERILGGVQRMWIASMPYAANVYAGHTAVGFTVNRDGSVNALEIIVRSGVPGFDNNAERAVRRAHLLPLPSDYPDEMFDIVIVFWVNERPFDIFDEILDLDYHGTVVPIPSLLLAARDGGVAAVRSLLEGGAKADVTDTYGVTALMAAAMTGHIEVVHVLLEVDGKVDRKTNNGYTALIFAAQEGHSEIVQLLLEHDAKVNVRSKGRTTPLMAAVSTGHAETVRTLVQAGANVNAEREKDRTVLMLAAANGSAEIVRILLNAEAKADKFSKNGWTAKTLAELYRRTDVSALLSNEIESQVPKEPIPEAASMGDGIEPPVLKKQSPSSYTKHALEQKIEGEVVLEVVILKDGTLGSVRILRPLDVGLDLNAVECVRQWVFVPGKLKGQPVDVVAEIEVNFSILEK